MFTKNSLKKNMALVLVGLAFFVLGACAPATSTSTEGAAAAAVQSQTVTMNPLGTLSDGSVSAVSGTAVLTPLDNGKTQVVMTLSGLEPNGASMGHVHVGDCSVVGPVATGLNAVEADASGSGTSVSEITMADLPASAYIAFHQRGPTNPEGVGSFVSCGEITQ